MTARSSRIASIVVLLALIACVGQPPVRVLFIGNSFTAFNDLPRMVEEMAASVDVSVRADVIAPGGAWWRDHAASSTTMGTLEDNEWDFVVLQEQSMALAAPEFARRVSYPPLLDLATAARGSGGEPVLFMTWGHRNGAPELGHDDYSSMQITLAGTYTEFGQRLAAPVAPVGMAWWLGLEEVPALDLYQPDGSHPSLAGSYLAAAVISATLFDIDPTEIETTSGLDEATAVALRGLAGRAVDGEIPWES